MNEASPVIIPVRPNWKAIIAVMVALSVAGLALRLSLGWSMGFLGDLQCWQLWGLDPGEYVAQADYTGYEPLPKNYPPVYASVIRIMRWVHRGLGLPGKYAVPMEFYFHENPNQWRPLILYLKIPAILADIGAAWLLLALAGHFRRAWLGVGLAGLHLFSPTILYDGAYFGQTDTILVFLLIALTLVYLRHRPIWLGFLLVIAALTKAQFIFALPIFVAAILGQWKLWKSDFGRLIMGGLFALGLVGAMAWWTGEQRQFYRGYVGIVGAYPLVSVRAFNLWWLMLRPWDRAPLHYDLPNDTVHVLGPITYRLIGEVLFLSAMALIIWRLHRAKYSAYAFVLALVAAGWAFFNLCTQMHERYSVPAVGIMTMLAIWDRKWWWLTLTTSLTSMFNIAQVCPMIYPFSRMAQNAVNVFIFSDQHFVWVFFAIIHILMLPVAIEALWRQGSLRHSEAAQSARISVFALKPGEGGEQL